MRSLVWLRQDLRLHDQRVLHRVREDAGLILVYCLDPAQLQNGPWGVPRMGVHRRRFLADTLEDLGQQLAQLGHELWCTEGAASVSLPTLAARLQIERVVCEEILAPEEQAEVDALRGAGLRVETIWQSSLLEPEDLPFELPALPEVFSNFRRVAERAGCAPREALPPPLELPPSLAAREGALEAMAAVGLQPAKVFAARLRAAVAISRATGMPKHSSFPYHEARCRGGERAALVHLQRYFAGDAATRYKATRNGLSGIEYSTKFSPWLATGALSPRRIWQALLDHEHRAGRSEGSEWIRVELWWRDYFRFLHFKHGRALYRARGLSNRPTPAHDVQRFARWCAGQTGQPFIDAGMRELAASGYLSNRLRQNVASWWIHEEAGDYRAGAAWFESQLVDYDVYSNQGNWLYLSGRGTDPRGLRRFDPDKQARDYDPEGEYRRLWA